MRRTHVRLIALLLVVTAGTAAAHPPPPPPPPEEEPISWRDDRAFLEWSSWVRLGVGAEAVPVENVARSTQPVPTHEVHTLWDAALGADVTFPLPTSKVRLGPWVELRPDGVFGGGEVTIAGRDLDMFWYRGERVWSVRAGSSMTHVTGALAFGYRCPWKLWGPYNKTTRYMIGVRLVASASRSVADPNDWSGTLGIEFEPIGSLRYVAGIKSWY